VFYGHGFIHTTATGAGSVGAMAGGDKIPGRSHHCAYLTALYAPSDCRDSSHGMLVYLRQKTLD
jgi:hypothetical protein